MFNQKEYSRKYYSENKIEITKKGRIYGRKNAEKINGRSKQWAKDNPEKRKEYMKQYQELHREELLEYKRQWHINNRDKMREINRKHRARKRKTDLKYNLSRKMSNAIWKSLRGNKNNKHWKSFLDYTIDNLIKRLFQTMPKGYCWENYLNGKLHLDHVIPISAFNFTKPEHIDFKRCWALDNLRLLPAKENLKKNKKLTKPFQPTLQI